MMNKISDSDSDSDSNSYLILFKSCKIFQKTEHFHMI